MSASRVTEGRSRHGSRARSTTTASPSTPSFFIIHEPDACIHPSGGAAFATYATAASPLTNAKRSRKKTAPTDASPLEANSRSPCSTRPPPSPPGSVQQSSSPKSRHRLDDEERDNAEVEPQPTPLTPNTHGNQSQPELSLLNRCGSAPDLPLHSSLSSSVYSSSKKRLQRSSAAHGAHQVALQRSRLTPLPIDIRTGTLKRSVGSDQPTSLDPLELRSSLRGNDLAVSALKDQIVDDEAAIASLKQRLAEMERERATSVGARHAIDRQNQQLRQEKQQLQADKSGLQLRVDDLAQQLLQCQHRLDKLTDRYATVYSGLQKLADKGQPGASKSEAAVQTVVQALARENQDLQRKLRVLEARHVEDKAIASNHEKRLKRLRAEMEAVQHTDDAKLDASPSSLDFEPASSSLAHAMISPPRSASRRVISGAEGTTAPPTGQLRSSITASTSHLVSAEDFQFIDPNILKVLDKVDSQFSIANAIGLSATLKKWLNSCLHVVCSSHVPTVLQAILKRACELLHCEHAAVFHVDHGSKRLSALCSERGEESWELPLDKGILGYAARQNVLCNVRRAYDDPRFYSPTDSITGLPSREVLCIPVVHELQPQSRSGNVVAVLQMWNTTHQKPFTANDQVLGSLLAIHVGAVALQTKVGDRLLKANKKFHQISELPHEVAALALSLAPSPATPLTAGFTPVATVDLVAAAEKKLAECLGIKHVRVFALDVDVMKLWQVGWLADSATGSVSRVRRYSNVASSLCALVLHTRDVLIVAEPASEPSFNDMVDMSGGAGGLYLAAITSPWSPQPLGMVQVARSAKAAFLPSCQSTSFGRSDLKIPTELSEAGAAAVFAREREREQRAEDALLMELIAAFGRSFAGLLLHARAMQLTVDCPLEVQQAQLAFLGDRLSWLEAEQQREQAAADQQEAAAERLASEASGLEQRILESIQREKLGSSHSRQPTPQSTRPADLSAMHPALERRSSSNDHTDSPPSESTRATSRRISSAGSPLRTRTPQIAPAPAPRTPPSDASEDCRGVDGEQEGCEAPHAMDTVAGSTSKASVLFLDAVSADNEGDGEGDNVDERDDGDWNSDPGGAFEWEEAALAALRPGIDHVVVESPDELDDDSTEQLRNEDVDGGWDEGVAPDGEDAGAWVESTPTPSGLGSTGSAYSIELG